MHYDDNLTRSVVFAVAFGAQLAGHYVGDHWVQTSPQACKKGLNGDGSRRCAVWHCAKHVLTWTATVAVFLAAAGWWLQLPLKPGWVAVGLAVNAVTHFIADLRTPLIWLARVVGRGGYVDFSHVMRPSGDEATGPGTAIFELDQSWHITWLFVAALLVAGAA